MRVSTGLRTRPTSPSSGIVNSHSSIFHKQLVGSSILLFVLSNCTYRPTLQRTCCHGECAVHHMTTRLYQPRATGSHLDWGEGGEETFRAWP